jgi:hypothetical protein
VSRAGQGLTGPCASTLRCPPRRRRWRRRPCRACCRR